MKTLISKGYELNAEKVAEFESWNGQFNWSIKWEVDC